MAPKQRKDPAAFVYQALTDENKRQVLQQRLAQLEAEHFNHTLNLDMLKRQKITSPEQAETRTTAIGQSMDVLVVIEDAHATVVEQIKALQ